ncbi:hypothetical protein GCM10011607_02170 [Shewanella inventionis]|uniref:Uncharacterized protein n=1 Tax=Shewanella inventionis TaxID=1738770 RepID=A0ABQ1IN77_9GAMM|nr:hypothetical protein GCM10011607_02170 [Shewanella inventionis]
MLPSIKQFYALGQAILKAESVAFSQPNLLSPNGLKQIKKISGLNRRNHAIN